MPILSRRLEAVLALISPCRALVDVGTNHALLPIAAVERGLAQRAIASDLRAPPLRSARATIQSSSVADKVMLLRQDGLSALARNAVDAVSMAGMSGELMVELCEAAPHVLGGVQQLVTQPNSDPVAMRAWALSHGWHLAHERMVKESGQFFAVCAFCRGDGADPAYAVSGFSQTDLCLVGPKLLAQRDPTALLFCEWQCERLGALVERAGPERKAEFAIWQAARAFMSARPA